MEQTGKFLILGWLAKNEDRVFRQRHIAEATGISRQLVKYHIDGLLNLGVLEKIPPRNYQVANHEKLIESLVNAGGGSQNVKHLKPSHLLDDETIEGFNKQLEIYFCLKSLGYPYKSDIRIGLLDYLNETINQLTSVRKFLQDAAGSSPRRAAKILQNEVELWEAIRKFAPETKEGFNQWLEQRIATIEEDEE